MGGFFAIFGLIWLVLVAFWIWALVDCLRVPDDSMYQSGTKLIWVLVIVLANWIGAIIYLVVGRPARSDHGSSVSNAPHAGASAMPPTPPPPPGTTPGSS